MAEWYESQNEVHLMGFPLNRGREILGSFILAPRLAPDPDESVVYERVSVADGSEADGSVAGGLGLEESGLGWGVLEVSNTVPVLITHHTVAPLSHRLELSHPLENPLECDQEWSDPNHLEMVTCPQRSFLTDLS